MHRLDFVPLFYISTPLTDFFQDLFCTLKFQNGAWFFYANSDHNLFYLSNPPQILCSPSRNEVGSTNLLLNSFIYNNLKMGESGLPPGRTGIETPTVQVYHCY